MANKFQQFNKKWLDKLATFMDTSPIVVFPIKMLGMALGAMFTGALISPVVALVVSPFATFNNENALFGLSSVIMIIIFIAFGYTKKENK